LGEDKVVLVTGGTGFVGSHLVKNLLENGYTVHLLVRGGSRLEEVDRFIAGANSHVHDGSTRQLLAIVKEIRPQVVFHLASLFIAEHSADQIDQLVASNVLFGTQLLEAMVSADVRFIVNTGTAWQHFHSASPRPSCLYAATKQAFQDILDFYSDAYDLRAITLKLFDTYGPGDRRRKLFWLLKNASISGEALSMSQGEQEIDLVHIEDVVDAFRMAESRLLRGSEFPHEIYSVSSRNRLPLRAVVDLFGKLFDKELRIKWGERPYRRREIMVAWDDGTSLPNWTPKVSLEDGLRRMLLEDRAEGSTSM
jgi:nucleoside-diphosphate-sugar epimerase